MATIKPIEGRSVHQIQSGQVIVDICSVVKELVENSLDAGATSIDVRFKNQGLDSIEVQDNGKGIAPEDFDGIALKHYTSKLSNYDDLDSLETFGFRGEALSSLCALAKFRVTTARASDGPKGSQLEFETSGKLKSKSVVASTKGTTVSIEKLFYNLPVRRKELEKNIKREYGKALAILHSYACISTGTRFAVSSQMPKGKKIAVFSTKANPTTRENITNVYGAKTSACLIPLDLKLEMQSAVSTLVKGPSMNNSNRANSREVHVIGHISRPVVGEGRQAPDRQMFFVNSRPCGLPQVAKAVNEVYKSYNVTQSPFIFADLRMDTNAYDVNVSPDKRTVLLHDQNALLESLKDSLMKLFEAHDQSIPQTQLLQARKLPAFHPPASNSNRSPAKSDDLEDTTASDDLPMDIQEEGRDGHHMSSLNSNPKSSSLDLFSSNSLASGQESVERVEEDFSAPSNSGLKSGENSRTREDVIEDELSESEVSDPERFSNDRLGRIVQNLNDRIASQEATTRSGDQNAPKMVTEQPIAFIKQSSSQGSKSTIQAAFDRMRPKRTAPEIATVTVGDSTTTMIVGGPRKRVRLDESIESRPLTGFQPASGIAKRLSAFAAPGTNIDDQEDRSDDEPQDDEVHGDGSEASDIAPSPHSRTSLKSEPLSSEFDEEDQGTTVTAAHHTHDDEGQAGDEDYIDDTAKKAREEETVARLIAEAEDAAARPTQDNTKRAINALKGANKKQSTLNLMQRLEVSTNTIRRHQVALSGYSPDCSNESNGELQSADGEQTGQEPEERLSLTVSKSDFGQMRIIGQFNLGFIIAMRLANPPNSVSDELFIIDQHASDEKYNFERLQRTTILDPQRLVHPHPLSLTAIEEEVIEANKQALSANGFLVDLDTSDDALPVGQRCKLLTLPTSREVTFTPADLEELLAILGEQGGATSSSANIPRPGKVRKLLAMRACRSSIMVGKTLSPTGMEKVVRHMGEIDKPWNCPHGRPTMRHLFSMAGWHRWVEGDGIAGLGERRQHQQMTNWSSFVRRWRMSHL